jgi:hypothetical protein
VRKRRLRRAPRSGRAVIDVRPGAGTAAPPRALNL